VTQCTGLTLQDAQVVTPVVDRAPSAVATHDDSLVLGDDLAFGGNHQTARIHAQTDWPIGKGRRHTVAVALEVDEAGGRDALDVFHVMHSAPFEPIREVPRPPTREPREMTRSS